MIWSPAEVNRFCLEPYMKLPDRCFNTEWVHVVLEVLGLNWQTESVLYGSLSLLIVFPVIIYKLRVLLNIIIAFWLFKDQDHKFAMGYFIFSNDIKYKIILKWKYETFFFNLSLWSKCWFYNQKRKETSALFSLLAVSSYIS